MFDKILSGRFLLTIACAIVFVWATMNKFLEAQAVAAILASVFASYFAQGQSNDNKPKPPTAGMAGAACLALLMICGTAQADMTIPGAKSGIIYAPKTNQAIAVNTIKVATIKMVDINAGVARTDGVAASLSFDLSSIKASWLKLPVLDLTNYINLGAGCAKFSGEKDVVCGPYASVSWKF